MQPLLIADGTTPVILELVQGSMIDAVALCPTATPLLAITRVLEARKVDTLHLLAHGNSGGLSIGGQWIDADRLQDSASLLTCWDVKRIVLWSCQLGNDDRFIQLLAQFTGAEVFASRSLLGLDPVTARRHWTVREAGGSAELNAVDLLSVETLESWDHQLVTLSLQGLYQTTPDEASSGIDLSLYNFAPDTDSPLSTTEIIFSQEGEEIRYDAPGTISYLDSDGNKVLLNVLSSRPVMVGTVLKGFYVWIDQDRFGSPVLADSPPLLLSLDNGYFAFAAGAGTPKTAMAGAATDIVRPVADASEILFIDSAVTDKATLIAGTKDGVEIVILDAGADPWSQMTEVVSRHQEIRAIHIVSHGNSGEILLGGKVVDSSSLTAQSGAISSWQEHLTSDADILVYGCNLTASPAGLEFVDTLARITAADVAASNDLTGTSESGGNWILETATGTIDTAPLAFYDYRYTLTAPTITSATYDGSTNVLAVTGTLMVAGDTIDPTKLTLTGQGGATYTLTSPTVTATSATAFSITLNAVDQINVEGLLNKNGASSSGGTTYNLAGAANWDVTQSSSADLTGNGVTLSNVQTPTITRPMTGHQGF